jgi:hypothetical protein
VINKHFLGYEVKDVFSVGLPRHYITGASQIRIERAQNGGRSDQNGASPRQSFIVSYCNFLWLRVIVQDDVNKSNLKPALLIMPINMWQYLWSRVCREFIFQISFQLNRKHESYFRVHVIFTLGWINWNTLKSFSHITLEPSN